MKVCLHMYNGIVQQNPLCVESCVTKEFPISLRLSPTMFDADATSVLLRAHLCTAVDSMCRKPWVRNCSREQKGLYNGNVQQNSFCAASCVTKDVLIFPRFSPTFFYRRANPAPYSAPFLYTPAQVDAPCRLEAHYACNKKLNKCVIFSKKNTKIILYIAHHYLQYENHFVHSTSHVLSRMYSSTAVRSTRRTLRSKLLISM